MRRELALVAAGLLLLLGAGIGAWTIAFYQRSPEMVVRRFMDADVSGGYLQQEQCVSSAWDSRLVLSALQTFRRQTGVSAFRAYRVLGSAVSGNSASVQVELAASMPAAPTGSPSALAMTFLLVREDGAWKIDGAGTLAGAVGVLSALAYQQLGRSAPALFPPGGAGPAPGVPWAPPPYSPAQPGGTPAP